MMTRDRDPRPRVTEVSRFVLAPRSRVYAALLDPALLPAWKVPYGMTLEVHEFDAREGGTLRVSLAYDAREGAGKSSAHTDTYRGQFMRLVPGELVIEADEFETEDPAMMGVMTSTIGLRDAEGGGTMVSVRHEGVPPGVSLDDNETGWHMALDRLADLFGDER